MTVAAILASAQARQQTRLGTAATYTPVGGVPRSVTLLPHENEAKELPGADDYGLIRTYGILASEVATVQFNDKISIPDDPFAKDWRVGHADLDESLTLWVTQISRAE